MRLVHAVLLLLLTFACPADAGRQAIINSKDFGTLVGYLHSDDINQVAFTLWRMESIDDNRVSDLFISLWEKDGKYRKYYDPKIENNVLIRMVVAQALIQFGYYYSGRSEQYLIEKTSDRRPHVRVKAAELLAAARTVNAVERLYGLIFSGADPVAAQAFDSLLSIARKQRRIVDQAAVELARKYMLRLRAQQQELSPGVRNYIQNKGPAVYDFSDVRNPEGGPEHHYPAMNVYPQTLRLLTPYVSAGDAYAMYVLGKKYLDGNEVPHDAEKGEKLLIGSAKNGYSDAYYELAERYASGNGLPKNPKKEIYYRKRLAKTLKKD